MRMAYLKRKETVNSMHYNWGIVGSGWIAHDMANALIQEDVGIYGVASGHYSSAIKFSEEFSIEHVYENYQSMFEDENIDIVYIATPHNSHYEIMKNALLHNKHVFCEKAITLNSKELDECVKIAKERHLVISDGVTLFHMPLFKELKKVISSNSLGPVKMIQVNFGSFKEYDVNNRLFNPNLAGGALLDIGVYAVSFARWFMSSKPNTVLTTMTPFETGVDESSGILLQNKEMEIATISLTMRAKQPKRGLVACENGYIEVYNFPRADKATITYTSNGHTQEIVCGESGLALNYEIRDMEEYVSNLNGQTNLQNIQDVMDVLTQVQKAWGKYE